jgi:hypothetical protein
MIYIALQMIILSDNEAAKAAAGVAATAAAWLAYWWLRRLGRRIPPRPRLEEQIQRIQDEGRSTSDYYI